MVQLHVYSIDNLSEYLSGGVHMYLWGDSYVERDSYKEFICI